MTHHRTQRPGKFDRIINPDAEAAEMECHYAVAPFDEDVWRMDAKWGVDRLPGLVSTETAARYGRALAALNDAIRAHNPEAVRQNAENCRKGLAALDREATQAGAAPANPEVWQMEVDGFKFAILKDNRMWPALRKQHPDMVFFTDREIALAVKAYHLDGPVIQSIKENMPNATVSKITPKPKSDFNAITGD